MEELIQKLWEIIEDFIEQHPEFEKDEVWEAIENMVANR